MQVRYYDDPRSRQPHIYGHNVAEHEVEAVLDRPMEDRPGGKGVRIALGQTDAGRYLRVVLCSRPHSELGLRDHCVRTRTKGEASSSPQT